MARQKFLTMFEAAKLLRCSSEALRMRLRQGGMPWSLTFKLGRRIYFDKKALMDWIEANRQKDSE